MGRLQAEEFRQAVHVGEISEHAALSWHLRNNHYPPLPHEMVEVAEDALRIVRILNDEPRQWEREIRLPDGMKFKNKNTMTVMEVFDEFHLDSFV